MPEIHSVLTTVSYTDAHFSTLKSLFAPAEVILLDPADSEGIARVLPTVDVAVLRADLDSRYVNAPNLAWVHCDHAGLDKSATPEVLARTDLIVTGSAGRAAPALAHHAMFLALAAIYDVPRMERARGEHDWSDMPNYADRRGLFGKTIGIVGMGHTGRALAPLAKAFGMSVLAWGRAGVEPFAGVDEYLGTDRAGLDRVLAESDVIVLAVRLTNETRQLIGAAELAAMKKSAYLVNIARGPVVDEAALVAALEAGTIAGAGLDVFEQEPLPADAAIWDAPNAVLTRHATAEMPDLTAQSLGIIAENVRRYRADEPMLNRLRASDVYTP